VASIDGLAEASFYGVLATPTLLVIDTQGREIAGWRGEPPGEKPSWRCWLSDAGSGRDREMPAPSSRAALPIGSLDSFLRA
jgi:hypothetical protein